MLDESTPETPSNHGTYQGLQWSVLLQGILEWGWRVGSVVHGVLLIWGYKPATGQRRRLSERTEQTLTFQVMTTAPPQTFFPTLVQRRLPAFLHKSKSGVQRKGYPQIKEGQEEGEETRTITQSIAPSMYRLGTSQRWAGLGRSHPVCPLCRTVLGGHDLHKSPQIMVEAVTWKNTFAMFPTMFSLCPFQLKSHDYTQGLASTSELWRFLPWFRSAFKDKIKGFHFWAKCNKNQIYPLSSRRDR